MQFLFTLKYITLYLKIRAKKRAHAPFIDDFVFQKFVKSLIDPLKGAAPLSGVIGYLSLPEHLIFIGVLLAKVGKSCQDYCKDLGNDYACDTRMITNNRSEIFGINCDDSTTHAVYSESYHPSYNEELNRCEGFIGVPAKFDCNAQSPSNKKIARLCNCVSPCM